MIEVSPMVGSLITRLIPLTANKAILRQKGYSTDHITSSQGFPQGNMRKAGGGLGMRLQHKLLIRQLLCCGVPHPPTIKVIATPLYIAWEEQQTLAMCYVLLITGPPGAQGPKGQKGSRGGVGTFVGMVMILATCMYFTE